MSHPPVPHFPAERGYAAVPPGVAAPQDHQPPAAMREAIRARGVPITLADGSTVRLVYSMAALADLEAAFGNIGNVLTEMTEAERALSDSMAMAQGDATDEQRERVEARNRAGAQPSIFRLIVRVLLPALADQQATHPRTGQPFYLEDDERTAARLLDVGRLREYVDAFGRAFAQAFHADRPEGGGVPTPQMTTPTPSPDPWPGPTGTTSGPSWATGATPTSGA